MRKSTNQLRGPKLFLAMRLMAVEKFTQLFKPKLVLFPGEERTNIIRMKVAKFSKESNSTIKITVKILFLRVSSSFLLQNGKKRENFHYFDLKFAY